MATDGNLYVVEGHLSTTEAEEEAPKNPRDIGIQRHLQETGGVMTVEADGSITDEGVTTHTPDSAMESTQPDASILASCRRKGSSIPVNNWLDVAKTPDDYFVKVGKVELSVRQAINIGALHADAQGNITEVATATELAADKPMTEDELQQAVPIDCFSPVGRELLGHMEGSIGALGAEQCLASMIGAWSEVASTEPGQLLANAGEKLRGYMPQFSPEQAEKIAGRMLEGLFDGIAGNVSAIDPSITEDAMLEFVDTLNPDVLKSLMLGMAYGSYASLNELIERFYLKNTK